MTWYERMFEYATGGDTTRTYSQAYDCAVAAVQDRFNAVPLRTGDGPDFACAGEGVWGAEWRSAGQRIEFLRLDVKMYFSDRIDRERGLAGASERWTIRLARDGSLTVSVGSWNYIDVPVVGGINGEPVDYKDLGGGNFVRGFFRTSAGWWHLSISLDRIDFTQ